MTNSSSAPDRKQAKVSMSSNIYLLLLLLLPLGWWIGRGGSDFSRRVIPAAIAVVVFILAIMIGWFAKIYSSGEKSDDSTSQDLRKSSLPTNFYWVIVFLLSIGWWFIAGGRDSARSILFAAASLAAFAVGAIAGFIFSSFGEELATFGKIRDWIIAGITGATFAELAEQGGAFKKVLQKFAPTQTATDFGLVTSMAVVYFALGFYYMFLQRELILNVLLAKSRAELGRLDGDAEARDAIQKLLAMLSPSLLTGVEDISNVLKAKEVEQFRQLLDSDEVQKFLTQAEGAVKQGHLLDWDTVSKVAYVYYYKVYCTPDKDKKQSLVRSALQWIRRALVFNPLHADLTMKCADMEMIDENYPTAISILDHMVTREDAPVYVKQWLGYALLYAPGRLEEAIRNSQDYLQQFPQSSETMLNLACAYAQLYCQELSTGKTADESKESRSHALRYLEEALQLDPASREYVQKNYSVKGESFECMDQDNGYREVVGLPPAPAKGNA
jgi:tetratricopeptide (TPR) repeat protein